MGTNSIADVEPHLTTTHTTWQHGGHSQRWMEKSHTLDSAPEPYCQ